MCGIIGQVFDRDVVADLIDGLKALEYRGYDSAGVAVVDRGEIRVVRSVGKIALLEEKLGCEPLSGSIGIAHTRWATHGRPTEENAHPHTDFTGNFCLVHNGIIENYLELKQSLKDKGIPFASDTDTEVITHLIGSKYAGDFAAAVAEALSELRGSYAVAVICRDHPGTMIAAKQQSPLILGLGAEGNFVASDVTAFLKHTRSVIYLADGEMAVVKRDGVHVEKIDQRRAVTKEPFTITWDWSQAQKCGFKHFMLKEIHQQPEVVEDVLRSRLFEDPFAIELDGVEDVFTPDVDSINIVACGTSWHAGLVGKFALESVAKIPVSVDYASEFRYRDALISPASVTLAITQSGETADTLAAVKDVRAKGMKTASICNVVGSSVTHSCDLNLYTQAGPEIGVASTKAFTSQLALMYLLALKLAAMRRTLSEGDIRKIGLELRALPRKALRIVESHDELKRWARLFHKKPNFLFLGRGISYPVALEGALKLKEISYIHAEGYPAGEMKHGPIALIDENTPAVIVAPKGKTLEKAMGNFEEVKARDGEVLVVTNAPEKFRGRTDYVYTIPDVPELLSPVLTALPLQLFAYYTALIRGCDIDQPRNLAKSVVVE
jgi:glucosamine--fructose-6-phosphate aminotransferase (isomerizing)